MKKNIALAVFLLGLGGLVFGQAGISLGLGFQYGRAWVTGRNQVVRDITEPGVLFTLRFVPQSLGGFARVGLLFPSEVTEGDLTLNYDEYDYIMFINGGLGLSFQTALGSRFSFILDAGLGINDLLHGGSFKDTIDGTWKVKLENLGTEYSGGHKYENIEMDEVYNDLSLGLLGNAAVRFYFTQNVFMELGVAASFDFLRFKFYRFSADLKSGDANWPANAKDTFPADKLDDPDNPTKVILESDKKFTVFQQFTLIPSITVGFRF
ncbi:MAG: hypothetical protein LBD31_00620 [Treponema sp.]|jgi:hypothetical protein|nr:hypothetical protein [Treponema sp.]